MAGRTDIVALIDRLQSAVNRRVAAETQIAQRFEAESDPEEDRLLGLLAAANEAKQRRLAEIDAEFAAIRSDADVAAAERRAELIAEQTRLEAAAVSRHEKTLAELQSEYGEKEWVVDSLLDEQAEDSPQRRLEQHDAMVARTAETQAVAVEALQPRIEEAAAYWKAKPVEASEPIPKGLKADELDQRFNEQVAASEDALGELKKLKLARWVKGGRAFLWWLVIAAAIAAPVGLFFDPTVIGMPEARRWPIAVGFGAGVALLLTLFLLGIAWGKRKRIWNRAAGEADAARRTHAVWMKRSEAEHGAVRKKLAAGAKAYAKAREDKQSRMAAVHQKKAKASEQERDAEIAASKGQLDQALKQLQVEGESDRELADADHASAISTAEGEADEKIRDLETQLNALRHHRGGEYDALKTRMARNWSEAADDVRTTRAVAERTGVAATWDELAADDWRPNTDLPDGGGLVIGTLHWAADQIAHLNSPREGLPRIDEHIAVPALLPLPGNPSVVFSGAGVDARRSGERALMVSALRALTTLPAAQSRLTVLDPVGLGEPFSSLMHLADFDERTVGGRIWTEPNQIEARLADLTEHMENVLQTYLRGDFGTIEEYNRAAGEVAEPYRFLVVNGFPHRFTDLACRRLMSIAASGPRCGVFVLMWHDASAPDPHGLDTSDLFGHLELYRWSEAESSYKPAMPVVGADVSVASDDMLMLPDELDEDAAKAKKPDGPPRVDPLATLRLEVSELPEPGVVSQIVRNVGEASKNAGRVEVAFAKIAPQKANRWESDSRKGLDVPLGRAGATKLQHARFGSGTAQHMLVAGKTGSGKSTFLHALITNASLHYSPEELRFFLIDFKKGVEFKAYAPTGDGVSLPHADVIAVESEREFGVSALKRLDAILDERGELFRAAGVADIAGYRDANPETAMPRILLVIDEFQEFFVEDDKVAQEASLHLDRLIRQGRAFGVHCVLGSQTLGGAYSLARSTLGQIGIRVALQCSEADAHLILSEDNTAARLLGRPGEAIYNDAGGLVEGNQHFQVAYLADEQREAYLTDLTRAAFERFGPPEKPPVVFEGNKPARLSDLTRLRSLLHGKGEPQTPPTIAVGEAVEIKPHTEVVLPRQAGRNVLVVGSSAEQTRGVLAAATIQLAAASRGRESPESAELQAATNGFSATAESPRGVDDAGASKAQGTHVPCSPVVVFHDPDLTDGVWEQIVERTELPIDLKSSHEFAAALQALADEMASRDGTTARSAPACFLVIDGLQQFRSLRRPEDDYGFSSPSLGNPFGDSEEAPTPPPADPGKLLAELCENGPEKGIHVLASVDSATSADRSVGRKGMREFGDRVLFQMNANDSSQLIDTPAAAKLDSLAGLVFRDATGESEKFRPFSIPDDAAIDRLMAAEADRPAEPPPAIAEDATGLEDFVVL